MLSLHGVRTWQERSVGHTVAAVLIVQRQDGAAHELPHTEEFLQGRGPSLGRLAWLPSFLAGAKFVSQHIRDLHMPWSLYEAALMSPALQSSTPPSLLVICQRLSRSSF